MSLRNVPYIKTWVREFDRKFRVYLNFEKHSRSYISEDLVSNIDPSLIQSDSDGNFIMLNLDYKTVDGHEDTIMICFDVIQTNSFDFVLGDETLENYESDELGLFLEGGEVPLYFRG